MRIIIYGLGAVGGVIAARLAQGGANVVGVARGAHLEAVRANGLNIRSAEGVENVKLAVVGQVGELTPAEGDVVLITTKTKDVPAVHDALAAWNPDVSVVCGTNGVEHERMALPFRAHLCHGRQPAGHVRYTGRSCGIVQPLECRSARRQRKRQHRVQFARRDSHHSNLPKGSIPPSRLSHTHSLTWWIPPGHHTYPPPYVRRSGF